MGDNKDQSYCNQCDSPSDATDIINCLKNEKQQLRSDLGSADCDLKDKNDQIAKMQKAVKLNLETIEILNDEIKRAAEETDHFKNLYCKYKQQFHDLEHEPQPALDEVIQAMREEEKNQEQIAEITKSTTTTLWPFHQATLKYLPESLFASVAVFCFTVYKIAQMIGF